MNSRPWILGAALAAAAAFAQAEGDAPDVERPSMRTPVPEGPGLTREAVRDSRDRARDTGRMGEGEIADTPAVLRAREDFAAAQAEVLGASEPAREIAPGPGAGAQRLPALHVPRSDSRP